ncbi:MAG: peptide chain release factor N(5)-glutamine methyltransferase [Deltaproteobacteria bacterium]|nr:peptide chain release factor N(5)-glutamine methyltransferase [Deltaproteobacteria bacterium]
MKRIELYVNFDKTPTPSQIAEAREMIIRRGKREPVAYITPEKEFYSRTFIVNGDVLIPRPETEAVVEAAVKEMKRMEKDEIFFADIGTGSGNIAITLLLEDKRTRCVAVDINEKALATARKNAERFGVELRMEFIKGDVFESVPPEMKFDMIVSNPPYISEDEVDALPPDVIAYEPRHALFAEEGGTGVIGKIIDGCKERLLPGGCLVMELSRTKDMAARIEKMLEESALFSAVEHFDPSVITGRR